jgi:hypothetical protein
LRYYSIVVELRDNLGTQSEIVDTYIRTVISVDGRIVELGGAAIVTRLRVQWQRQEITKTLTLLVVVLDTVRRHSNQGGGTCWLIDSLGFVVQFLNSLGNRLFIWVHLQGWR